jgi:hypothetical protein
MEVFLSGMQYFIITQQLVKNSRLLFVEGVRVGRYLFDV